MGKTSSVNVAYPAYSTGSVSLNGNKVATVSKIGNEINSNYNMNDYEKQAYDYAQQSLAQSLPSLNVFSDSTKNDLQSQVKTYKEKAMRSLEQMYTPMLKNMTNDIASRFGNLDNSMFMYNLSSLENYRANALSQLAQDVQSYQSDLYNNELNNRYNYLSLLNNLISGTQNNALNYYASALNNTSSGNSYNIGNFNNQLANALNMAKYNNNLVSSFSNGLSNLGFNYLGGLL